MKPRPFDTLAVHAGRLTPPQNTAASPPLFQANSYIFRDLEEVEEVYGGTKPGAIYGRYGTPNGAHLESALAELEGAQAAVAAASGMAAIAAALWTNLTAGDRLVATRELYGGTHALLESDFQLGGIDVVFVDQTKPAEVEAAVRAGRTRLVLVEALTNPLVHLADVPQIAAIAKRHAAALLVDSTFATPALFRPIEHGADLVVHSLAKYIGGHADTESGILAGRSELIARARAFIVRNGSNIAPFEAWLALRGLRTLALRMERHTANARAVAVALAAESGVCRVYHPALAEHPQAQLAARLFPEGTGGMLAFEIAGGALAVAAFLRALRRIPIVHSMGEITTTIAYPAVSSHRSLSPEARTALGVSAGTLRLSVGIEDPLDIISDLRLGLAASRTCAGAGATLA